MLILAIVFTNCLSQIDWHGFSTIHLDGMYVCACACAASVGEISGIQCLININSKIESEESS